MLSIYKNIREKRIEKGLSQSELAKLVGYSDKSTIAKIENGTRNINQEKIIKFAEVFGCTPGELMGNDGTIEEKETDLIILENFAQELNRDGLKRLLAYAEELNELNKYRKD